MSTAPETSMQAPALNPMLPTPFVVRRVQRETADTISLELAPADHRRSVTGAPGQFNMVYVFGVGEVPMSITGDPAFRDRVVHTTRAVGAVSAAITKLKRGSTVGIRGPFGSHWPIEEATGKDVVMMAGGIGLAPLRPVLYHIASDRSSYRNVFLLYGTRTPDDLLHSTELEKWSAQLGFQIHVTVDRAPAAWQGNVGVVTSLVRKVSFDPSNTVAMICGPEIMMRYSARELEKYGLARSQIYLSLERNMKCAVGFCGHCQLGPHFICKNGPVFRASQILPLLAIREL